MNDFDAHYALILLEIVQVALLLILMYRLRRLTGKIHGPVCGHCGRPITGDPIMAISTEKESLLVYRCRACGKETPLPTKP